MAPDGEWTWRDGETEARLTTDSPEWSATARKVVRAFAWVVWVPLLVLSLGRAAITPLAAAGCYSPSCDRLVVAAMFVQGAVPVIAGGLGIWRKSPAVAYAGLMAGWLVASLLLEAS